MNVLITGANGFVGRNLAATLENIRTGKDQVHQLEEEIELLLYTREDGVEKLREYLAAADFIFHFAESDREEDEEAFMEANYDPAVQMLDMLEELDNPCPIVYLSSDHAIRNSPFGHCKKQVENLLREYGQRVYAPILIYRLQGMFGKWGKIEYNSVTATFCHHIARGLPIMINKRTTQITIFYIDDVVEEMLRALDGCETWKGDFCVVKPKYVVELGELVDQLYSFRTSRENHQVPDLLDDFTRKPYATYLSYLPEDDFSDELKPNVDERGSFTEILRTEHHGQFSVNISKPGVAKGQHWHHTKSEKFLVVSGKGVIRFRQLHSDKVIEYYVSGDKLEVVDIPTGYTHNIENLVDTDLITFMWATECFDPERPDTFALEV